MHNWSIWQIEWKCIVEAVQLHCSKAVWYSGMTITRPIKEHVSILSFIQLWSHSTSIWRYEEYYVIESRKQMQVKRFKEDNAVYYTLRKKYQLWINVRVLRLHIICYVSFFFTLFVCGFSTHSRIFHSMIYGDVTITGVTLPIIARNALWDKRFPTLRHSDHLAFFRRTLGTRLGSKY